jgi:erythromycin esterase
MMMHRTTLFGAAALTLMLAAYAAFADDDPRVRSLRSHAVALRSIEPEDEDFSDLEPLKKLLGEARIVQLGEQSHGDGATFHAKTRLIRFLHQEMGFDVLAFESGLYDCRKAWERFQAGAQPREAAEMGIFGIWVHSDQVQPLIRYLAQAASTDRPLELCGFDCQFTGVASHTSLVPDLQAFLNSMPDEPVYRENAAIVVQTIGRIRDRESAPTAQEQQRSLTAFETLCEALAEAKSTAAQPAAEVEFWRQFLKSTAAFAQIAWSRSSDQSGLPLARQFNPRDAQMGDNMIWLARERYPERKIIVWGATMHLLRNPHLIDTRRADLDYTGVEPMGQHLKEALGDEVFTIGFTAYEGQAGVPWGQPWRIDPAPAGSLEDLCVRAGLENAFVTFRGAEVPQWLRAPLVSRPLAHSPMEADWTQVVDGMLFKGTFKV